MKVETITFIKVNDGKLTVFKSSLEKQLYIQTHPDAETHNNWGIEPKYMLIDTEGTGWCLTPKGAITYNEAIELIKHYY